MALSSISDSKCINNRQWIFFVNVPLGLLSIILTSLFIKESRDNTAGRSIDYGGMLGITGGMFFITYALIKVKDYGGDSRYIFILLAVGFLFLLFFLFTQWKGKDPILPLSLLRIRSFNGAALTLFVVGAALVNISLLTSFFLTRIMGMTELKAGLVLSMLAVGSIGASAISGPLSNKYGSHWFAAGGISILVGATYSLSGLTASSSLGTVLLRLGVAGVGVGLTMAPVMSSAIRNVPEEKVGISSGVTNMTKALGSVLGVAIIVTVLQQNINEQVAAANLHTVEVVQNDQLLEPFVKEVLIHAVAALKEGVSSNSTQGGDGSEVSSAVIKGVQLAATKLMPEEQKTFTAESDNQFQEVKLLMSQAENDMENASVQAFSRTFMFASYLLIPGILFALFSDQWRRRERPNDLYKVEQMATEL